MTGPSLRCSANGDLRLSAARCGEKRAQSGGRNLWCADLGNEWRGREEPPEEAFFARNSRVMAVRAGGDRALDARGMILPGEEPAGCRRGHLGLR